MKLIILGLLTILSLVLVCSIQNNDYHRKDPLKKSIERGSEIYADFCVTCHLPNGNGVENIYPPLAKSDYLMKK